MGLGRDGSGLGVDRLGFWAGRVALGHGGLGFAIVVGFGGFDRLILGFWRTGCGIRRDGFGV